MHICVGKLTTIGSDNGLSPGRRQAIIWTNDGILLIGPLGTNFSEILIEILIISFNKMRFKVSCAKWRPFCLGLNVLNEPPGVQQWWPLRNTFQPHAHNKLQSQTLCITKEMNVPFTLIRFALTFNYILPPKSYFFMLLKFLAKSEKIIHIHLEKLNKTLYHYSGVT